jgi:ribosomal protein L24
MKNLTKNKNCSKFKKQSIKLGDFVLIICGNYKFKQGKVISILKKYQQVVVEGINLKIKFNKNTKKTEKYYSPIHVSNVKKV